MLCENRFFSPSKLQKKCKILSYVVASGLQYGNEENLFHYFFKVDKKVTNCWMFQSYIQSWFFLFTDVLVNAVARSSSIWTRHKLHPHDSCQWPCRVIINSRLELLMWIGMPLRLLIVHMTLILLCRTSSDTRASVCWPLFYSMVLPYPLLCIMVFF